MCIKTQSKQQKYGLKFGFPSIFAVITQQVYWCSHSQTPCRTVLYLTPVVECFSVSTSAIDIMNKKTIQAQILL